MDQELLQAIAATTGPLSTLFLLGWMWIKGAFGKLTERLDTLAKDTSRLERRVYALEFRTGVPMGTPPTPTPPPREVQ